MLEWWLCILKIWITKSSCNRTSQDGRSLELVISMAYMSGNILCSRKQTGTVICFYNADKGTTMILQSKDFFHEKVDVHVPQCQFHLKFPQLWNCSCAAGG